MKWRFAVDRDGNTMERVMTCDDGYRVARFTDEDKQLYWPSKAGEFLTEYPLEDKKQAFEVCERHHQIMG